MRLTKWDINIRKVVKPTLLSSKLLSPGNAVILATCQLHENPGIFGQNIRQFDYSRFIAKPELARNNSFRPFGGGRTYCPGRVFAIHKIFSFIAFLFHRWDVQLAGPASEGKDVGLGQKFPVADDSTITLGITRPLPGEDVWVELSYNVSLS
ncbi:hypothetical protein MMC14_009277 [Varicellaria rhodocarpa]|nr:hypothetical protein [Varicellaria rhodocarpa]